MSTTTLSSNPKNSLLWRNNSGELDVFEAAGYFSAANEHIGFAGENRPHGQRVTRMSLDMPIARNPIGLDGFPMKETKKFKQPSSPGGRLASFLNSLFSQTALKKKKKPKPKSSSKDNLDQEQEESRKRRSSIGHFRVGEGDSVRPSAKTPTKASYREFRSFSDHQKMKDEEIRFSHGNVVENYDAEAKLFGKFEVVDDGADSDSSSDLFDLPNYDLDLPVYGTTNVDRIRVRAAVYM